MTFKEEMKKYKSLSLEDRQKKVINLLKVIKDRNENLTNTYNIVTENKNLPVHMIDDLYKVLLEAIIYQQWLNQKASNDKISVINNSLYSHLEQEKLEKEAEKKELEAMLA